MGVILRRKKEESVILKTTDGIIEIKIISGTNTRLNITAPASIKIWRKELLDDNYKLLPKYRGIESIKQDEQNLHVHRCESFHTPRYPEIPQKGVDG